MTPGQRRFLVLARGSVRAAHSLCVQAQRVWPANRVLDALDAIRARLKSAEADLSALLDLARRA